MILLGVWYAGVLAKGFAAYRTARNGVPRLLPAPWVYLAVSFLYAGALAASRFSYPTYLTVYSAGLPVILILQLIATSGIFWLLAVNFPNFRAAGSIALAVLGAIGIGAAWATSYFSGSRSLPWMWNAIIFAQHYASMIVVVVLLSALLLLPRLPYIPIPQSAIRAAWFMVIDAGLTFCVAWLADQYNYGFPKAMAIVTALRGILVSLLWMTLKPTWEFVSVPLATAAERAESRAAARRFRQIFD